MYNTTVRPQAISHRGLRTTAPENTIPAFRAALAAGAEGIELDVHTSVDGIVFVHHDAEISPLKGAHPDRHDDAPRGAISALHASDIVTIRLADDTPIPTLDQVLTEFAGEAFVYVELKAAGCEDAVKSCIIRHESTLAKCAVHSFDHRAVKRVVELLPSLRTGILQVSYPIDSRVGMRAAGATDLWQHVDFVDAALVADVHASGGRVIAWTANSRTEWQRLTAAGVDGICTDRVDEYVAWRDENSRA